VEGTGERGSCLRVPWPGQKTGDGLPCRGGVWRSGRPGGETGKTQEELRRLVEFFRGRPRRRGETAKIRGHASRTCRTKFGEGERSWHDKN